MNEKNNVDVLNKSYIQEVDGTGGSRVAYRGPIARVKWYTYQKGLNDYNKNETKRNAYLSKLESERKQKLEQVFAKDAKGFLGNIRILGRLSDEDVHVMWSTWLIRLLFLCIELVPVLIKLGGSADIGLYDKLKDMNDNTCFDLQKILVEEKKDVMKIEQSILLQEQKNALMFQLVKSLMNSKTKDYEFFLDKVRFAIEQQLKLKVQVIEKVKDENARQILLGQVAQIYDGYVATLESLVDKSKKYHTTTGGNII